jgi:hypothetical protein
LPVCRFVCVRDLPGDRHGLFEAERAACDAIGERRTVDVLERERADPGCLFETVDAGNMRVIERRQELRLALEASDSFWVVRESSRQYFERCLPVEMNIARAIYLTHAASPNDRFDEVGAHAAAGHESAIRQCPRCHRHRLIERARQGVFIEQRGDFPVEFSVVSTESREKIRPLRHRTLDDRFEDRRHSLPSLAA